MMKTRVRGHSVSVDRHSASAPPRVALYNHPKIRALFYQLVLLAAVLWFGYEFALNARANLAAQNITSGFGFLENTAGFGIKQSLIPYNETDTYGRVFLVGLLNTLLVAGIGIVFATILGFFIGIARLSPNWLVARLAGGYVELIRNLPLLFQILFWYLAVLGTLPGPRQSMSLVRRNFHQQSRHHRAGAGVRGGRRLGACRLCSRRGRGRYPCASGPSAGGSAPAAVPGAVDRLALVIGLPLAVACCDRASRSPSRSPQLRGFNFVGGVRLLPEFVALLIALTTYTAAFIAEVVRAGILAVPRGQTEAALALGLRRGPTLRLIVVPQALRVIVPPLTNQYLNLTKNSSLAVAIGYPDLFAVFAGTTLQPDRPGDRDHRHHHGGLSRDLAAHQRADELVQRPYPAGGAVMPTRRSPPMSAAR